MGVLAALGVALAWAIAAAVISHHVKRIDPVSIAALRMVFAALFSVAALYALNSQGDLASMSFNNMWQLAAAGMLAIVIGDPLYVVATKILGLMRAFHDHHRAVQPAGVCAAGCVGGRPGDRDGRCGSGADSSRGCTWSPCTGGRGRMRSLERPARRERSALDNLTRRGR